MALKQVNPVQSKEVAIDDTDEDIEDDVEEEEEIEEAPLRKPMKKVVKEQEQQEPSVSRGELYAMANHHIERLTMIIKLLGN